MAGDDDGEELLSGGANMSSLSWTRSWYFLPDSRRVDTGIGGRAGCGVVILELMVVSGELVGFVRAPFVLACKGSDEPNFRFLDDEEGRDEFVTGVAGTC